MNQPYLITLNAPPLGEGDARYAVVSITPGVLEAIRRCRRALASIADLPGYGHITRRLFVPALVFSTLPEGMFRAKYVRFSDTAPRYWKPFARLVCGRILPLA